MSNCWELWCSKSLALLWLPTPNFYHSPTLWRVSESILEWVWRIDVSFAAWVTRTLPRARAAGVRLPGNPEESLEVIRAYLEEMTPGISPTVDMLARSPVYLPGDELMVDAREFARFGLLPKFE